MKKRFLSLLLVLLLLIASGCSSNGMAPLLDAVANSGTRLDSLGDPDQMTMLHYHYVGKSTIETQLGYTLDLAFNTTTPENGHIFYTSLGGGLGYLVSESGVLLKEVKLDPLLKSTNLVELERACAIAGLGVCGVLSPVSETAEPNTWHTLTVKQNNYLLTKCRE